MKRRLLYVLPLFWGMAIAAVEEPGTFQPDWGVLGSARLAAGVNQAGHPCPTAVGTGQGNGYGGLVLHRELDLTGAGEQDSIRFRVFQSLGTLTVMLRNSQETVFRSVTLPPDGTEVVLKLNPAAWKQNRSVPVTEFGRYDLLILNNPGFKYPSQSLGVTQLSVEKNGRKLFEYNSINPPLATPRSRVINCGRGGYSSADVLAGQLPQALRFAPTLAVVMIGTNDMVNSAKLTTVADYEKNLRNILTRLTGAGSKIILVTLPPCIEELLFTRHKRELFQAAAPNARIDQANAVIAATAAELQIPLIDFHKIISDGGDLNKADALLRNPANAGLDGVHPTAKAYRMLAKAIADIIKKAALPDSVIVCIGDSITYGSGMTGAGTATGDSYPGQLAKLLNESSVE